MNFKNEYIHGILPPLPLPPTRKMGGQFSWALENLKFSPTPGGFSQIGGLTFSTLLGEGGATGFSRLGDGGSPSPTDQKLLIPPTRKSLPSRLPLLNFYCPHQRFILLNPLNSTFLLKIFFVNCKVNCNLKLPLNSETHVLHFFLNITEKGRSQPLFIFVLSIENNEIIK